VESSKQTSQGLWEHNKVKDRTAQAMLKAGEALIDKKKVDNSHFLNLAEEEDRKKNESEKEEVPLSPSKKKRDGHHQKKRKPLDGHDRRKEIAPLARATPYERHIHSLDCCNGDTDWRRR